MGNPFVHVELQTQDPTRAKAFYAGLFPRRGGAVTVARLRAGR